MARTAICVGAQWLRKEIAERRYPDVPVTSSLTPIWRPISAAKSVHTSRLLVVTDQPRLHPLFEGCVNRHGVSVIEPEVFLQPRDHGHRLHTRFEEPLLLRQLSEVRRCFSGFCLLVEKRCSEAQWLEDHRRDRTAGPESRRKITRACFQNRPLKQQGRAGAGDRSCARVQLSSSFACPSARE